MNWKNISIGKRIAVGFGCALILLATMGILSVAGIVGIVNKAEEVIEGNKLSSKLGEYELAQLNWVKRVNSLLTDEEVTELNVQTDDHVCPFGKWLFGDGRKPAEMLLPSLAPLLEKIEEPHRIMHESAAEVVDEFRQPHNGLAVTLAARLVDHDNWAVRLRKSLASEARGLWAYQTQLTNVVDLAVSVLQAYGKETEGDLKTRKSEAAHIIRELRYGEHSP